METKIEISLFGKNLKFANEELYKCVEIAINCGYKVHTFCPSGYVISQIFIDNGITFGSISANYSGVQHSTRHKPVKEIGTGFGFGNIEVLPASEKVVNDVLLFCPTWVSPADRRKVIKQSWEEYQKSPIAKILKYAEITI